MSGGRPEDYTVDEVREALERAGGVRLGAASILKCSPSTVTNYIERYPELKADLGEIELNKLDFTETKLWKKIEGDDLGAIIFFLKCKGKARGWSERYELGGPGGGPIPVSNQPAFDASKLSTEELETMEKLLAKGAAA